MSSRINLNSNIEDVFPFTIGGLDYDLKYPTMADLEPVQELNKKRLIAEKKNTPESVEEIAELNKEQEKIFHSLITPVGHETPIADTLKKQPLPVLKAFNKMVSEQFSAE